MSAGYTGEGGAPTAVVSGQAFPLKAVPGQNIRDLDQSSLRCAMWTNAGGGYSYSSPEPHIASMVLRRVTEWNCRITLSPRLAKLMGWGAWGYCLHRGDFTMPHANGAGSIAVHATDALRFGYCLLHKGNWAGQQLVPPDYISLCNRMSQYNPHAPFSLQFEQNSDGHVAGAPRDAFWKSGSGWFRHSDCAIVGPGDLQNGRQQRPIRTGAHRFAATGARIIRATIGNPSPERRSTKAAWAGMTAFAGFWKWCARRCGKNKRRIALNSPLRKFVATL